MPEWLLYSGVISTGIYASIMIYLLVGLLKLNQGRSSEQPDVSVVVAARNEAANISRCLEALRGQTYPQERMEFIIVNDRSSDNTGHIITAFQTEDSRFKALHIQSGKNIASPKKVALSRGVEAATSKIIMTCDADCIPPSKWIKETVAQFRDDVGVVIGPAPFAPLRGLLANILSLENFGATLVAAGASGWNTAVTCTGRNLSYRKEVFEAIGGFKQFESSLSGDDDLFLQTVRKKTNWKITFAMGRASAVPSSPPASLRAYIAQRRRHVSASKYYNRSVQSVYLIFNLANLALFLFAAAAIISREMITPALLFLTLKIILDFTGLLFISSRLRKLKQLFYFPLWECFHLLNQVLISPLGFIGRPIWKG